GRPRRCRTCWAGRCRRSRWSSAPPPPLPPSAAARGGAPRPGRCARTARRRWFFVLVPARGVPALCARLCARESPCPVYRWRRLPAVGSCFSPFVQADWGAGAAAGGHEASPGRRLAKAAIGPRARITPPRVRDPAAARRLLALIQRVGQLAVEEVEV